MTLGPQKPHVLRPPALPRPGAADTAGLRTAAVTPASKISLWISLGLHACLIAAACSVSFMTPVQEGAGNEETAGDRRDFKMAISTREPQASQLDVLLAPPSPLTPSQTSPQIPLLAVSNLSALTELATFEPMASVITETPSKPAATHAASGQTNQSATPATPATATTGKKGGRAGTRKGSGEGKQTKRSAPTALPELIKSTRPPYPAEARAAKKQGVVHVLVQVRANGSAASTGLYRGSGNSQLDQAAVKAAHTCKFSQTPSLDPGATIAVVVRFDFAL
jgi:TonB family protein